MVNETSGSREEQEEEEEEEEEDAKRNSSGRPLLSIGWKVLLTDHLLLLVDWTIAKD